MTLAIIWISAGLAYAAFYVWYVGFNKKLTTQEIDEYCRRLAELDPERVDILRTFLSKDTGRDFMIANLLKLHKTTASGETGKQLLDKYQLPYLRSILKKGCHPIAIGLAATASVENWGIEDERWDVSAFVRYRSRRDLAEALVNPAFQDNHPFKVAALEKTFAFACDPALIIGGGPKIVVPLVLVTLASLSSLLVR